MRIHIKSLIGYRIDSVVKDATFPHYAVVWGRKRFWQKSKPILQICTYNGMCSEVYTGKGMSFSYEGIVK